MVEQTLMTREIREIFKLRMKEFFKPTSHLILRNKYKVKVNTEKKDTFKNNKVSVRWKLNQ